MHEIYGGSVFRLGHDDYDITLSSVGQRLMFAFYWVHVAQQFSFSSDCW